MSDTRLQSEFSNGKTPKNLEGFYRGSLVILFPQTIAEQFANLIGKFYVPWKGKVFFPKSQNGDNIIPSYIAGFIPNPQKLMFKNEYGGLHAFTFKTSIAKGINDDQKVLNLNYDLPENHPKIRTVVDELVEVSNNSFLGKVYMQENNNFRLVGYFRLRK